MLASGWSGLRSLSFTQESRGICGCVLPLRHLFCNQCFSKCFMLSSLGGWTPTYKDSSASPGPHCISRSQHLEGDHPNPSYQSTKFLLKSMDTYKKYTHVYIYIYKYELQKYHHLKILPSQLTSNSSSTKAFRNGRRSSAEANSTEPSMERRRRSSCWRAFQPERWKAGQMIWLW